MLYIGSMFTHMLIPLDGSALSKQVLPYAKQLAIRLGCDVTFLQILELKLVHSYELDMAGAANMVRVAREEANRQLDILVQEFGMAGIKATAVVKQDVDAADAILQYITQNHIDVIAMTTHGRSGFKQMILGSIANRLVQASHVPVMLVRPENV